MECVRCFRAKARKQTHCKIAKLSALARVLCLESRRGQGAGVAVQGLGGTGPIRAGHVPYPNMTSNLSLVGPLADRPAPPATWLADDNLRRAVMRAVRNRSFSGELLTRYWRLPRPPLRFGLAVTAPAPCMLDCPARTKTLSGLFPGCWAAARSINPKRTGITVMFNKINRLIIFRPV